VQVGKLREMDVKGRGRSHRIERWGENQVGSNASTTRHDHPHTMAEAFPG
jgi:hypothetical protein